MLISEIITKSLLDKQDERKDYKQTSWHASGLGSCLRGTYLKRLGVELDTEMDERQLRKFDVGNIMEDWLVDLIERNDDLKKVERQVRIDSEKWNLSGKADAVLTYQNDLKEVLEIKTQHSKSFWYMVKNGNRPHRHHEYQLWCYLKLLGIEDGKLVYISKDDLAIQEYFVKASDKDIENEVVAQLLMLNTAWKMKNPIDLPLPPAGNWLAKYCPCHSKCVNNDYLESIIGKSEL